MASFLSPILKNPETAHQLVNGRTGEVVAHDVRTAFDSATRRKGLLGLDGMPPGSALIIAPCSAIHTWFMRFAIDIAFVAKDGRVVKVKRALGPWRMSGALSAHAVVELPAGALSSARTDRGDVLTLRTP
jgi:uncharacterized membrane protein (UPF0127 family)